MRMSARVRWLRAISGSSGTSALLTASSFALGACNTQPDHAAEGSAWRAVHDTIADTIIVRTVAGSDWRVEASLIEELIIGSVDGPEDRVFGRIVAVQPDQDGYIYVLDAQVPVLRKYSADGAHVADVGGAGGGPGEHYRPDGIQIDEAGTTFVSDPGSLRINVYGSDGAFLTSWRLPARPSRPRPIYIDRAGTVYYVIAVNRESAPPEDWITGIIRFSSDGEVLDTVRVPYEERLSQLPRLSARRDGRTSSYLVPLGPTRPWTISTSGHFIVGITAGYAVDLVPIGGGGVVRLERTVSPVAVNDEERAEHEERLTWMLKAIDPEWRWQGPHVPRTKRAYHSLLAGLDGRIWVQVAQPSVRVDSEPSSRKERRSATEPPALDWVEPVVYDVFLPNGRYLGAVRVPDRVTIHAASQEHVWGVKLGEFDEQYVVRYRVRVPDGST